MKSTPAAKLVVFLLCLVFTARAGAALPAAPSLLTVVPDYATNEMRLDWQDNAGDETGYRVERSTGGGGYATVDNLAANTQTYTDTTVAAGVEYSYRVAAHNADGDAFSDEVSSSIAITWTLSNGNHEMMHGFQDGTPNNVWGFHEGIDIQDDGMGGQEVVAARGGVISHSANGNPCPGDNVAIEVRQGAAIFTDLYCHMQSPTAKVVGESVSPGEQIGEISASAYAAGRRHVHQMLIDGAYALPANGNTFRSPYSIFPLPADQDPLGTVPGLEDVGGDGAVVLYKRPDNSYFTTAAIHGDVDISAEITDAQGTNPRVGVLRAGYWIGGGPVGSETVRDSTTPYLLHDFDGWFGQAVGTANFDAIYDEDQDWVSGAFLKRFHHLLTNTRGTDGSLANLDATQFWRTDARKGSGVEPNGSDAVQARENQDARFPDGTYFVHVIAEDMLNRSERAEPVLVDNSRPYIRRVSVFSGSRIVYRAEWIWDAAAASLNLQPATFAAAAPFTALRTQDITVEVEFSEAMASAMVTAVTPDGTAADLGVVPTLASTEPAHAQRIWRGLISNLDINDDGTHDGTHMLTIDGTDLAGNALLQTNARTAIGADHHNRDATGALRGTVGTDTIHGFRIGPLSGEIPVTVLFLKQGTDDPPAPSKEDRALALQTALNDYFDEVSYEEISFALSAHGWYQLDEALNWYETSPRTPLIDLVQEAITHAEIDGVEIGDYVLVITDEDAIRQEWSTHEAWPYTVVADPGWRLIASGTLNAATTDAWLTNLAGRMVGLIDLFRYPEVVYSGGEFVGPWSHMSVRDDNIHVLGWEKWRVGWLDETGTTTGKTLTRVAKPPVATPIAGDSHTINAMDDDTDAVKMVAIEIGDRLHYTVEYRRQQNLDAGLFDEGVVITKANDYINFGEGPVIVQESDVTAGDLRDAPYTTTAPRDVFNDVGSGVTVSVVSINATEAEISLDYAVPPTENDVFVDPHDRWKTDDIWVDAPDINGDFEADPLATIDAGELPVPGQNNKVYGRVRNQGNADATNFELHLEIHDPWGTGGPWAPLNVKTIAFLQGRGTDPAGDAYDIVEGDWTPSGDPHACARLTVHGVANDAVPDNNWTQENFSEFDATRDSPYSPVTTRFDVENPYDESIVVFFKLDGVPASWSYTMSPERLVIPARGLGDAQVTLHPHDGAPVCSKEVVTVSAYTPRVDTLKQLGGITMQIGMKNAAVVSSETSVQCGDDDPIGMKSLSHRDTTFNTRSCDIHTQGCTDPAQPHTQVAILYTHPDGSAEVRYVTTDEHGCYTDTITGAAPGRWETEVVIDGDDCTEDSTAPPTSVEVPPTLCGGALWCCWLWLAVLIALIAALLWFARWRCDQEKARLPFIVALAVTLFLGWLLLSYCAINLMLFWFSFTFAIVIALMLMCWLPFVPCIGRGGN